MSQQALMMIAQAPDGAWFEAYRGGAVYRVAQDGTRDAAPLLTLQVSTEGELGLLGLALHPGFPSTPHIFFYYATRDPNTVIHVDRYQVAPATGAVNAVQIDASSRHEILAIDRGNPTPFHAAGAINFDPTAAAPLLYVATGDGDIQSESQDPNSLNGKLIRIDLSDPSAAPTPEIVALGLRNPFRWSFDRGTGDIWIGDVGDADFEEVTRVPASDIPAVGGAPINLGWPVMEGFMCRNGGDPTQSCGHAAPLVLPAYAYPRSVGVSVIGGYVYRGARNPGLQGGYYFNDFFVQNGERSWQLLPNTAQDPAVLDDDYMTTALKEGGFVSYAEDRSGELYGVTMSGVFQLVAGTGPTPEALPDRLSKMPCFQADGTPTSAMIPYELNAPLWSDGATKRRWMAIPDGTEITLSDRGDFDFPVGSVLVKEFTQAGVRVETRLLLRHPNGAWRGYTYAWIDSQGNALGDAELVPAGSVVRTIPGAGTEWNYPSRGQCLTCHTGAAGWSLGLEIGQLNREQRYPRSNIVANQVHTLSAVGILRDSAAAFGDASFAAYDDPSRSLADRTWSYLHSNCSGCHQPNAPGFGGRSNMPDIRYDLGVDTNGAVHPLAQLLCHVETGADHLGLGAQAQLVSPGQPGDWSDLAAGGSALYLRMAARAALPGTSGAMPSLGTEFVDAQAGLPLVKEWIESLSCP